MEKPLILGRRESILALEVYSSEMEILMHYLIGNVYAIAPGWSLAENATIPVPCVTTSSCISSREAMKTPWNGGERDG